MSAAPTHSIITHPHTLALAGLVRYSGDVHPLSYGGVWFDPSTWVDDGYSSAVRLTVLDDGPDAGRHIVVERLVINRPKDVMPALRCCGMDNKSNLPMEAEIECCLFYGHYDPDESDYREPWSLSFVIPDDGEEAGDFAKYARIHGTKIASDDDVWALLNRLVGCELYQGR